MSKPISIVLLSNGEAAAGFSKPIYISSPIGYSTVLQVEAMALKASSKLATFLTHY